jgi:hypothetical protein
MSSLQPPCCSTSTSACTPCSKAWRSTARMTRQAKTIGNLLL